MPCEISHIIALQSLKTLHKLGLIRYLVAFDDQIQEGLSSESNKDIKNYKNKLGIAAGLDKNGDYIDCLASLGIGFIEVGTVTPRPQIGNPKPRIFRNRKNKSLLNRLGFNNYGVEYLVEKLKERKSSIPVGVSIGKNFDTPNSHAHLDYLICLEKVYKFSDYIAVNISSPNTENLRELSGKEYLNDLLLKIKNKQDYLASMYGYKNIFIKVSPDEDLDSLKNICEAILETKLDGIICSNTTVEHSDINGLGGLSGAPLKNKATKTLEHIKKLVGGRLPIIASGGVMSVLDYQEKIKAGADLVQIYTGFIFGGPKLIKDILNSK